MPNIKSAKKRVKVSQVKALRNKSYTSSLKTAIKKANTAIEGKTDNQSEVLTAAVKKIDRAVAKGVLHKNTAARKKSRLALAYNKTKA